MLSIQEKKCEHVDNIDDEWVIDSATMLFVQKSCSPRTKQETLVL